MVAVAAVAAAVSFGVVYGMVPPLIRRLESRGMAVPDVLKSGSPMVARPGGPAILAGIAAGTLVVFWHTANPGVLALLATTGAAFVVGYVDDRRVMGGWFKPTCLCAAALPMILLGSYDTTLEFPPFGVVQIPVLYIGVILAMIPITGNTVNSIDVMNGVASGYMTVAGLALAAVLAMLGRWEAFSLSVVLVAACLAFYRYHRIPSRIFPGDSGVLAMGAMYGCVAITGGVEVVAAVALLPAVANSFFFLASVRRIVEHRQVKRRGVIRNEDMTIQDSGDPQAPITLVRLILRKGPMTEAQVSREILRLAVFAAALAVATGVMMMWMMATATTMARAA